MVVEEFMERERERDKLMSDPMITRIDKHESGPEYENLLPAKLTATKFVWGVNNLLEMPHIHICYR